jgi:hypothetical protein
MINRKVAMRLLAAIGLLMVANVDARASLDGTPQGSGVNCDVCAGYQPGNTADCNLVNAGDGNAICIRLCSSGMAANGCHVQSCSGYPMWIDCAGS